ncbi:MAG: hypothetical protein MUQ30_17340, partial [Anaerolineae bacterium]|nr:hypothetical protein [Anaerolineae bacterium]
NALTHGILAKAVIPDALEPYESHEAFDHLPTTLSTTLAPGNAIDELLVQQLAAANARLACLTGAELPYNQGCGGVFLRNKPILST